MALSAVLNFTTFLFALMTAIFGILMVNSLFKDKLKNLFDDVTYFIFFFLVSGYTLFALGETMWYLLFIVFGKVSAVGMPDVYWVLGSLLIFLAFFTLSISLRRTFGQSGKSSLLYLGGAAMAVLVFMYLSSIGLTEQAESKAHLFIGFFYPLISSLIVVFSAHILLYFSRIGKFRGSLLLLFFANCGILLGDIVYISATVQPSVTADIIFNFIYSIAYFLSAVSFFGMFLAGQRAEAK